ncbi:MAG: nucleotidyltransferase family protein [Chloroflexi bacterium]|nr:nucleotidyltransferase family protein [Chloroflexota bacterium]
MVTTGNKPNIEELKPKVIPILKKHQVSRASAFGSIAAGTATEASDLDLLVEFTGQKSLLDLVALKLDLEAEISRKVDVMTYRSLNPLIRRKVLRKQVRLL